MATRYLIGLDLGTTNSAVAYVDTAERLRGGRPTIHRFAISQVVHPGESAPRDTLPSFLYFPTEQEAATVGGPAIVGVYARDHGALVPGRQVASAKSWLCNPAVDRSAPILPWGHGEEDPACSPVEASARYLGHIRDAWNAVHADAADTGRFEHQQIVLTVPASFDEEARELTLAAARAAHLDNVTLLEEPLAAFYAWMATHAHSLHRVLHGGEQILVCDVGGGTTDFTLIRASLEGETAAFERTAVGEHLLLGGDNLDLALARRIQAKLGDVRLTLRQQQALARLASAAKEHLLTERAIDRVTIAVPAAGSALVGGRLSADLTRDEVVETLREGFLPGVGHRDLPARTTRPGLREFGLPYAAEPAITRHLAAFLQRAAPETPHDPRTHLVRPDAVLFNGGFFAPAVARDAVVRTLESWFEQDDPAWHVKVLENRDPAVAVATGAAYYAFVREHGGLRVSGGSARAYYIGIGGEAAATEGGRRKAEGGLSGTRPFDSPSNAAPAQGGEAEDRGRAAAEGGQSRESGGARLLAVCVMPRGTEEGTTLDLIDRTFTLATNRPVAFPLYSATTRHDRLGEVVEFERDEVHQHAPLVTILRYGRKSRQPDLPVHLSARFTEVGTLEIWCESNVSDHRWRLQFELRATENVLREEEEANVQAAEETDTAGIIVPDAAIERAVENIRAVFAAPPAASPPSSTPETLVAQIENVFGVARQAWPLALIRRLSDALLDVSEGRKRGPRFEARWLNLTGFCLRPGFGATLDEWRLEQLRRVYVAGLSFPRELQNQAEWLVLWQRVAGGLTTGQQQELYQRNRPVLGVGGKKEAKRINPQVEREGWRLLASLELLPATTRASLGTQLLSRLAKQPENAAFLWSLGRLGARIPSYGPLNTIVPAGTVATWLEPLLARPRLSADAQAAIAQMAARTGDAHLDVDAGLRTRVIERLRASGAATEDIERVRSFVPRAASDAIRLFGESLPEGLRLARLPGVVNPRL